MGLLDWFRRRRDAETDIIPLPALRPPESPYWCDGVRIDDHGLAATRDRGPELRLEFQDIQRVAIRTTDEGPGVEDVYWVLSAGDQICLIPHGAEGESELFDRLLKLPGFNNQAMIAAMTCTENAEFECWSCPRSSS